MAFTRAEVRSIRERAVYAFVAGPISWTVINGIANGRIDVEVEGLPPGVVSFRLVLRRNRPTFVLVMRGDHPCRLDVNQPHREFPGTHMQWRDDSSDVERTRDAQHEFPPIPSEGDVPMEQYAATFGAFASYVGVDTSLLTWNDPPGGSAT